MSFSITTIQDLKQHKLFSVYKLIYALTLFNISKERFSNFSHSMIRINLNRCLVTEMKKLFKQF